MNETLIYFEQLQSDATELAREALECEAKEEKLVTDAVKHLNQANLQIHSMSKRIIGKSEEAQKQKQDIAHLLTQVKIKSVISNLFTRSGNEFPFLLCFKCLRSLAYL